jgi:hypothetical protein
MAKNRNKRKHPKTNRRIKNAKIILGRALTDLDATVSR